MLQRTWAMLLTARHVANVENILVRYHLAECLVRIAIANRHPEGSHVSEEGGHMPFVYDLIDLCERNVAILTCPERERSFSAIVLLVLLKQCREAAAGAFVPLVPPAPRYPLSADALYRIAIVLLLVIRGPSQTPGPATIPVSGATATTPPTPPQQTSQQQEPFAQDVCCAALCHVYDISLGMALCGAEESIVPVNASRKPLSERIASLVISTLCREKKGIQGAGTSINRSTPCLTKYSTGVAVAGETTGTSAAGDRARALERALEGGTTQGLTIPGLGGVNGVGSDVLAAAAATAAAELNIYTSTGTGESQDGSGRGNASDAPAQGQYGVYTKVCKVAKKAGDASLVFAVLSLVRRDPSFGCVGSETEHMFCRYKAPMATIDKTKTKTLLPMLYQAKFDPTSAIREVMRNLWAKLIPPETESALLSSLDTEVLKYLASNLTCPQWRDRESACLALEMFIPQRAWSRIRPSLEQLWGAGMRVLDDIRDSTRLAALSFMKVLSNQV